ncbi:MAG: Gfo/Idh/MocA family oxidoreductase [Planctomycetota bacterium]
MNEPTALASRRSFLKQAAGTAAACSALSSTAHAAGDEGPIKVGLVGCGGRGTGAAVNALNADPRVKITALADLFSPSIERCISSLSRRYAERMDVPLEHRFTGFDSYKGLLGTDIDVVLLASPPHYRPDHMEAAVEAGKHIFCEKPVAVDPVGVRRVEASSKLASDLGLNLVSGLCWRYAQGMVETVERIHDGQIGDIISTQADYLTNALWTKVKTPEMSEMEYQCFNWYNYTWLSGDHIVEQFIHSLDKALWLRHDEPPVRAYGLGGRQRRHEVLNGDIYDHFAVVYEWADGTRTYANTRQIRGCMNQTEDFVFGTQGSAKLIRHQIEGQDPWRCKGDEVQMHQQEQNEFFKALRGERDPINNGDYMCKSTLLAILGREVCYSGKEITWDEISASPQDLRPASYAWGDAPEVVVKQPGEYVHPKPEPNPKTKTNSKSKA